MDICFVYNIVSRIVYTKFIFLAENCDPKYCKKNNKENIYVWWVAAETIKGKKIKAKKKNERNICMVLLIILCWFEHFTTKAPRNDLFIHVNICMNLDFEKDWLYRIFGISNQFLFGNDSIFFIDLHLIILFICGIKFRGIKFRGCGYLLVPANKRHERLVYLEFKLIRCKGVTS